MTTTTTTTTPVATTTGATTTVGSTTLQLVPHGGTWYAVWTWHGGQQPTKKNSDWIKSKLLMNYDQIHLNVKNKSTPWGLYEFGSSSIWKFLRNGSLRRCGIIGKCFFVEPIESLVENKSCPSTVSFIIKCFPAVEVWLFQASQSNSILMCFSFHMYLCMHILYSGIDIYCIHVDKHTIWLPYHYHIISMSLP